jgi:hypothetical protein
LPSLLVDSFVAHLELQLRALEYLLVVGSMEFEILNLSMLDGLATTSPWQISAQSLLY